MPILISRWLQTCIFTLLMLMAFPHGSPVQPSQGAPSLYGGLRWRMIGPFRGGRTVAVAGIQGRPETYYFGGVGGGIFESSNAGETWAPVFDSQPIASIGALAVAASNPEVIYAGSGEADFRSDLTYGNGMYKSTDGGKSWVAIGLPDSRHISRIVVDPHNPNVVLVAAQGHAYGPNPERGVFRSTDGGATWQKVLYKDEYTGAIDLAADPDNPQTLFAALWRAQRTPWSAYPPENGGGAIYKSTDQGLTWKPVSGGGLPQGDWGRIGLAVAAGTRGQRVYALIDTLEGGLFRSDDGGQTWALVGTDARIRGRLWYFGEVDVDPKNPDVVYLPNVSIYRSTDGGKTFIALKGAPGGDDYHTLWIDPANPLRMIFGSDQGAGITVDGGKSWTSWYNQATAQLYHVAVDNQFPYRVYGAQQDSGTVSTASRSDFGSITFRDWYAVGAGESGYIAPDPSDANIVYGGSTYGELFRFDRRTGQSQDISPVAIRNFGDISHAEMRFTWTSPLVFSPQDSRTLYFGSQYVLKTSDRGSSWQKISPDLTGSDPNASHDGSTTLQNAKSRGYGVVYTIAPSPVAAGQIWAGTDTGLIQLTRDGGKTWNNVTPPRLGDWSKISIIDAGHFDAGTAYAAVDRHRLDDINPYIYRTHDFGKTWTKITAGIPDGAYVRAVREDPVKKGLLFAGTELGVYFSANDGDSWELLRLNMPVAPIHDLVIKDNDLVAATHGRSFWILDDIAPLRQLTNEVASAAATLFKPSTAVRMRANVNHDTPLPPEVPAGENPPAGAILYYNLKAPAQGEVKLEVLDANGKLVRAYSSNDRPAPTPSGAPFPDYWFRQAPVLSAEAGMHRWVWDLRYTTPPARGGGFSMSTVYGQDVPREPLGPQVLPGTYQVRLTVNGQTLTQPLAITMDPRVRTSTADLQKQFALEMKLSDAMEQGRRVAQEIREAQTAGRIKEEDAGKLLGRSRAQDDQDTGTAQQPTLPRVTGTFARLLALVDSADAAPTAQENEAATQAFQQFSALLSQWQAMKK